jgi:hypothetical protein
MQADNLLFSFSDVDANTFEQESAVIKLHFYAKLTGKLISIN